jgi:hypothetical protein
MKNHILGLTAAILPWSSGGSPQEQAQTTDSTAQVAPLANLNAIPDVIPADPLPAEAET